MPQSHFTFLKKTKDWVILFGINTLISVILSLVGQHDFLINFIFSQSIGILIAALISGITRYKNYYLPTLSIVVFSVLVGVIVGTLIGASLVENLLNIPILSTADLNQISLKLVISILIGLTVSYYVIQRSIKENAEKQLIQQKLKEQETKSALINAELKLLQAQIEPHFLFNTLSNIICLIENEPKTATSMLQSLTQYLRVSLDRTRTDNATVADEVTLLESYLKIQKIRMGERLHYQIEAKDDTLHLKLPPLLIQPLVENAIKHGLEKALKGGEIKVIFKLKNNCLQVTISDTGCGLVNTQSEGIGLNNVANRLQLIYGEKASIRLKENADKGAVVILQAPQTTEPQ